MAERSEAGRAAAEGEASNQKVLAERSEAGVNDGGCELSERVLGGSQMGSMRNVKKVVMASA
ncbi:MAG TPA: hypothetical protein VFF62_11370, partial [Candidatus Nitrosocosmicus sp.]|nr:hypothetical protein [Candidatus Nitrosocosmicus sp.]